VKLTSIKLAGFKSFADPTQFQLPGRMVGVVGPNGCGKSNIMDAVRWVLGESRASELRGESMQDVIFNGSATRKPAARASVELVFDNSDHRAGGAWSRYAELAVKRVLTRDGGSSYSINGQAARRRDIQDIFLGTGLGPRAYAIIGQGMISRIIEARPEELRVFLEEAAGVSKYKERRKETAARLADTRENLTRVEDILRELGSQLDKLQAQAEVARQYHALRQQSAERQQQWWLLRRDEAQTEAARLADAAARTQIDIDARLAEQRRVEAQIEQLRQAQQEAAAALSASQAAFYEGQASVSRLEAEIRFGVEQRRKLEAQAQQIEQQHGVWQSRLDEARQEDARLEEALAEAHEATEAARASAEEAQATAPVLEQQWRRRQTELADRRADVAALQQALKAESQRAAALGQQQTQLQQRFERLQAERRGLAAPDEAELSELEERLAEQHEAEAAAQARVEQLSEALPQRDAARRDAQQRAQREAARHAELSARLAALRSLQEKVQVEGKLKPWLAKHGLDALPRLWTQLHTEPGWEPALEAALRERIAAIKLASVDQARGFAADPPPAKLAFFQMPAVPAAAAGSPGLTPLIDRVRTGDAALRALLGDWLHGVYCADSLETALAERGRLPEGAMFVVREGHAVGREALVWYAADSEQAGLLARQQEIENLERALRAQQLLAEDANLAAVRADTAYQETQQQYQRERAQLSQLTQAARSSQIEVLQQRQVVEQYQQRSRRLAADLEETGAQLEALAAAVAEGEARFEALDLQLADAQQAYADDEAEVQQAQQQADAARAALQAALLRASECEFAERTLANRRAELARAMQTAVDELGRLAGAAEATQGELFALAAKTDERVQAELQQAVAQLSQREQALAGCRSVADDLAQRMRRLDEDRLRAERDIEPLRERLVEQQLKQQAAALGAEQFALQLREAAADEAALRAGLPEGARPAALQADHEELERRIAALGAVNLAALEELGQASERKQFLDAQRADLEEAIGTLESAIRKIDLETRELLKSTFDEVNRHFGRMFPALFGGGEAKLVMTGEEILDAGVQVMAQPPGKRNSTIHLLSGGEKALTAVALVFAIFQLNPAPFCLLDEVDAPLDDANTERFAKLVQTMAHETQFLFISHNKITMEMAEQLIGVTMQEQGVSRVVAVDLEEAASFAEAA
jgi:chromosome segregation protein